ncbi:LuxR family transcriptional regulator [Bradyrhizobium sp. Arg237L]|uniref:LuxR family transcriptional regulator n=1 Tax=Bradyrhizobium sp. Arg237L TaxID=3003352 RepID=UPI00249EFFBC|nr:LuxR family transcriptional regulator [Bradyrhizobium sp. Arg237L]MDI4234116.1 LuxR family transcriptional regulator [Bradyrhizobium sp. Arg237L]
MHRVFQKFVDNLLAADNADAFAKTMAVTATALDLPCFAYLAPPYRLGGKPLIISSYPTNWVTHYMRNRYERVDPIIAQSRETAEPFRWGLDFTSTQLSRTQQEFLGEASEFGIRLGFTVPIHDEHGTVAALTFATDQRRAAFEKCIGVHAHVIQLMAVYFQAHIRRRLTHEAAIDGIILSPRELQCLEWASQGKSAWEIGQILGISRNTVAFYLNNAKEKLGVRTVVQAVRRLAAANKEKQN